MTSLYEEIQIAIHGIWSRRWIALAVAWGVALVGWFALSLVPNSYEARARVFIEPQAILQAQPGANPLADQQAIDQVRQTLASADNLALVVKSTDLAQTAKSDAEVGARIAMLQKAVTIVSQQDKLFEISAKLSDRALSDGANARIAAQVVDRLIGLLGSDGGNSNGADTATTLKILDSQIAARAKDLAKAEQARVDFQQRHPGLMPGAGSLAQQMDAARAELGQIDQQMVAADGALAGINGQLAGTPPTLDQVGGGGGQTSPLAQAMGELASARARGWTDDHPDVMALKRQIGAIRSMGGGSGGGVTRTPNPAYVQLRSLQAERAATASALRTRRAQVEANLNAMAAKQVQEPGLAAEQDRLDRDYKAIKDQYDQLISTREDARLRGAVRSEAGAFRVKVIDPPAVPTAPASPNRPLLLVAILIAAMGVGVGTAFALGQIQTTYATAPRLERGTGLAVIGAITEALGTDAVAERRRRMRQFAGAAAGLVILCAGLALLDLLQQGMSA